VADTTPPPHCEHLFGCIYRSPRRRRCVLSIGNEHVTAASAAADGGKQADAVGATRARSVEAQRIMREARPQCGACQASALFFKINPLPCDQLNQPAVREPSYCFHNVSRSALLFGIIFRFLTYSLQILQCFPSLPSNRLPAFGCGAWSTSTTSSALCTSASGSERTF
jgi:hypothetical protein